MDGEELGGTYVIAVEELGLNGLWSTIKDLVESRLPLRGITLPNKVGKPVAVPRLPLMFVLSTDMRLKRLKQYSHSPVTWFRNPHTHLILVSTADVHEYKSTLRAQLKRVTSDIEREWGGPGIGSEWLLLYVRPFELDPNDKSARRVFEKLCDDFASKRRERVVRLDIPLQAFTGPAAAAAAAARSGSSSSSSSRPGSGVQAGGSAQGVGVWGAGATGLDELCTGLRDSIRAAFEARQAAYDAEVRRLLNERRDPGWSFLTLYLVKDSFALMLEGAGLWEDAFQEYVELETVYLDTLEAAAAAAAAAAATPAEAAAAAVRAAADFGLTRSDSEDCASLLSSSWRGMRRLVLYKKAVQEFHFRQYLFAAQARVLLRLGRPVDVAERGLVFVQHFLGILAAREAAGLVKPWFKECWAFSACMALITAVTAASAQRSSSSNGGSNLQPEWDTSDLASSSSSSGPAGPAAQAAVRQLGAALAAEKAAAAAAAAAGGSLGLELRAAASTRRSTESDRGRIRSIITSPSPAAYSPSGGGAAPSAAAAGSAGATSASTPILTGSEWELNASSTAIKVMGGSSSSSNKAAPGGSSTPAAAAAAGVLGVLDEYDQDVPPLDLGVLRGQAVTPGTAELLLQAGEQRRELLDRLYCCLLGHLYHLARGELLRLGSALRLPEAAAAAAGSASILQLGRAAFAPAAAGSGSTAAVQKGSTTAGSTGSTTGSTVGSTAKKRSDSKGDKERERPSPLGAAAAAGSSSSSYDNFNNNNLAAGVELLREAAASGGLGPRMVAQLQELLLTPLCGFSQMINKYADGSGGPLTYEVHTPKLALEQDPLAAALGRADSQSTPYLNSFTSIANSSSAASTAGNSPTAAAAVAGGGGGGVLDRMWRGGSSSNSSSTAGAAGSSSGGTAAGQQQQQQQQSRLSKVSGDDTAAAAAAPPTPVLPLSRLSSAAAGTPSAAAGRSSSASLPFTTAAAAMGRTASLAGSVVGPPPAGLPAAAAAAAAAAVPKVVPEPCLLLASRPTDVAAELALQLEYTAGVWRSHSCSLQLPLQQPANISAAALQLPGGAVAVSITLSLEPDASSSLLLLEAAMRPQYGLVLSGSCSSGSSGGGGLGFGGPCLGEVLPMRVLPGGSAALCFMLVQDQGDKLTGSFEADGSSLLQLSYCLETAAAQPAAAAAAAAAADTVTITDPSTGQQLPAPPAADSAAAAAADEADAAACPNSSSSSSGGVMSLRLPFWLEFPSRAAAAATASLRATLLGPFHGRVGQPMTLSWQLSRLGGGVFDGTDLAGFSNVDLGSSPAVAASPHDDGSGTPQKQQQQQQLIGDSSSSSSSGTAREGLDEVLCYELVAGEPSQQQQQQQQDPLHSSLQGPNALAALSQQQQHAQNPSKSEAAKPWWSGGSASGMVRLGRAGGALAAVEVVIVPQVAGRQLPPRLLLRGLGGSQPLLVEAGVAGGLWVEEELCMHISG